MRTALLGIVLCAALEPALAASWLDQAGLELRFDSNISRGELGRDRKPDTALIASASGGAGYQLTDNGRLSMTYTLSGSAYHRFEGLSNLKAGLELAYRWKFGLGPYTPSLRMGVSASRLEFRDNARDGWQFGWQLTFAKRLSERLGMQLEYGQLKRIADHTDPRLLPTMPADVFDLFSRRLGVSGDYLLTPHYVLAAGFTLHRGDIVSTTLRNLPVFLASKAIALDEVFGPERFAYTMSAATRQLNLAVSRLVGGQASLTLAYEHLSSHAEGGIDYRSNLMSATYLHQF